MKNTKTNMLRKIVAIFIAVVIVFSLSSTAVVAADTPVQYTDTPIQYIDIGSKYIYITETGWRFEEYGAENAFVGDYFLYGDNVQGIYVETGEQNITLHNVNLQAASWHSALSVGEYVTLNLKIVGINKLVGHNHPGIAGDGGTVNMSLAENSSVYLDDAYTTSTTRDNSVSYWVTLNVEAGTSADSIDMTNNNWKYYEQTISKGTPAEHSVTMVSKADGHYVECEICNTSVGGVAEHVYDYTEAVDGHTAKCKFCGYSSGEVFEHIMGIVGEQDGHRTACTACFYYDESSVLNEHSLVYTYNDYYHTATCSVCNYITMDEYSHNWEYIPRTEGEGAYEIHDMKCSVCPAESYDYHYTWGSSEGDGHIFICYDCDYSDGIIYPHSSVYYDYIDSEYCAAYCNDCDEQIGEAMPHDMTFYNYYDDFYCQAECSRCGYYDYGDPILVEHNFSDEYFRLDSEYCTQKCVNCGEYDYNNADYHVESDPVTVAPSGTTPGYIATYCEKCNSTMSKTFSSDTILVKVRDIDNLAWEKSGFVLYVDGVPVELIRYMGFDSLDEEVYGINYDENKSYVFKYMPSDVSMDHSATISLLNAASEEEILFSKDSLENYGMFETIFQINTADYTAVDEALAGIPEKLEIYTSDSVKKLVNAVKRVERMLPSQDQSKVDSMARMINTAVNSLEYNSGGQKIGNGVINATYLNAEIYQDYTDEYGDTYSGYYLIDADGEYDWYDYEGDYVIIESAGKECEEEAYVNSYVDVMSGKVNIDLVNFYSVSEEISPINLRDSSCDVTLNLYGANASVTDAVEAGITVVKGAKLTIEDEGGNLIARGGADCAGIGSKEEVDAGSVTINGGTIFALSRSDGAGIGSGYNAGFDTITINGGRIWAECLSDDGSGIGVGDDGDGGDIIINGGDITALSVDDDGAGIGGADNGSVDSITINGGKIVAGSEDAAAIGSGQESSSSIGKITINGGEISASEWHDSAENLVGKGNSGSKNEDENNFVHINGGTINTQGTSGINPKPRKKTEIQVESAYNGFNVDVELSNGETVTAVPENGIITLYLHEGVTVVDITIDGMNVKLAINFTSFGGDTNTMLELTSEGQSDLTYYQYEVVGTKSGLEYNGVWMIEDIEAGTYTLRVSKENHATREYTIEVGEEMVVRDAKIHLVGDVTGDGQVRMNDMSQINAHVKETSLLDGYALACADVTGDGFVRMNDMSRVNAHVKETTSLWNF